MTVVMSFCGLCLLVAFGKFLRVKVRLLQALYLPSSVIAGLLGLLVVQLCGSHLPAAWTAGWGKLPGLLINVVFAALFLGVTIPPLAQIWKRAAPQLAYGQIVAWGQYVVGVALVLVLLKPLFNVSSLFGVVVPVGFEGGHGTAGGLGPTFIELNWSEGVDFCLASATAGIISAVVVGMVLVNWAIRKGFVAAHTTTSSDDPYALSGVYPVDARPEAGRQTVSPSSIDALALHLAVVGIAILIGLGLRQGLVWLELQIPGMAESNIKIMRAFPLFPLCMIGGLIVQLCVTRFARVSPIDHGLMQRLGGTALDFLVVAAISMIRIEVIAKNWAPFVIIVVGGILWNVFCVTWLARRMLPNCWFERAIAEMGQSMGVTATGLLLLRAVDPESKTEAASAFGYKQLLHEPFMGGGLWTSSAVLVVAHQGGGVVLAIGAGAIAAWLVVWRLLLRGGKS
ncbi:MAG: sodium:glutamate symporter [Verrucomicrobia bacterium]|jgi:glutamate:Na+ symporter, ESS family|nr:sodium:glutamate symporter [Verrucomicrobiota bacterium]